MRRFLSRYHPRYVRSLVYMLQASEYHVLEYLAWGMRVRDFVRVEKRKHLEWTAKAAILFASGWLFVFLWLYVEYRAYLAVQAGSDVPLVVGVLLIPLFPLALPYLLLVPLGILNLAQWPVERILLFRAKKKLAAHRGTRIAIAGSFGKTSMREILRTILSEGKKVAAPDGSENTPIAVARFVERLQGDEDIIIFELGEYYPGDVRKLCEVVRPEYGIITGVNEAHLERFKTLERTTDTIFELADFVVSQKLYINGENAAARARALADNVLYSRTGAANVVIESARTSLDGTDVSIRHNGIVSSAHSALLGLHVVGALSAAAHLAAMLGFSDAQIARGIEHTKPFAHRLERRSDERDVVTLDDSYNGNPDGVAAVIEFLSSLREHRRFYVTPGLVEMGERNEEVHKEIGRRLALAGIEKVVLIRNSATPLIETGLKESGYRGEILWFDDALKCYAALPHMTVAGDIVLLQNDWPDQYA
jgi:UDP-N-acetylmuramoyl-tripeptide--D-alanyl-D-alanine ligase